MSGWTKERVKKRGLEAFTKSKVEYAIGKAMDMPADEAIEMFMDICHHYHQYKMLRALKESDQKALFDEALL